MKKSEKREFVNLVMKMAQVFGVELSSDEYSQCDLCCEYFESEDLKYVSEDALELCQGCR